MLFCNKFHYETDFWTLLVFYPNLKKHTFITLWYLKHLPLRIMLETENTQYTQMKVRLFSLLTKFIWTTKRHSTEVCSSEVWTLFWSTEKIIWAFLQSMQLTSISQFCRNRKANRDCIFLTTIFYSTTPCYLKNQKHSKEKI